MGEKKRNIADISQLNAEEKNDIANKVELETALSHYNMIQLGAVANFISGLFIIWILYGSTSLVISLGWYFTLVFFNVINLIWAFYNRGAFDRPEQLRAWKKGFEVILAGICLTWGSLGILFASHNAIYELYTITFLQVVVLGFCFSSVTDFTIAFISIFCLVAPAVAFRFYRAIEAYLTIGYDPRLNLALGISLFILGSFLLAACYFGAKLVKKFFFLSFANTLLNEKLDHMNQFLEQKVKERTIELENSLKLVTHQATHDLLTDLPNQRLLTQFLQSAISDANRDQHKVAVVCFSLNEIDRINNSIGHHVGDLVIKSIAHRMNTMFSLIQNNKIHYQVSLSRKDVFVILINPIYQFEEVEPIAHELFSVLEEPILIDQHVIKLTACMGISIYPRDGNLKSLLMNADAAMLDAKQQGGNAIHIYESKINANVYKQLQLENNLHTAVKNGEFFLLYQPIIDLETGKISGCEALIRWKHSEYGLISPGVFIPLAEANGLIIPLGEWALQTACQQLAEWHRQGFDNLKVSVNLSAKQLNQKNITELIANTLAKAQLKSEFLELELTESEAFKEDVIPVIQGFKAMGVSLAIDDFGTGYSGLSNIKQFVIDKLKIDKSFIKDIETNRGSQAIVANIIALSKSIHIKVLAEGVEKKTQLDILQTNGCDYIQGYYFSPPVNAETILKLLKGESSLLYGKITEA